MYIYTYILSIDFVCWSLTRLHADKRNESLRQALSTSVSYRYTAGRADPEREFSPRTSTRAQRCDSQGTGETRTSWGNSPLEKKDVLRPMHSVGGGEFGGIDEEDEAAVAERYLVPFQITSLPSTVSRDSRKVL